VLTSDGGLEEGLSSEIGSYAGHLRLGKLIVLYANNHITLKAVRNLRLAKIARRGPPRSVGTCNTWTFVAFDVLYNQVEQGDLQAMPMPTRSATFKRIRFASNGCKLRHSMLALPLVTKGVHVT
jgi:hypothetical protein